MGRVKSKAKQKSATPIPFPHDGPIAYYGSYRNDGLGHRRMPTWEDVATTTTTTTTSLRLAHWLLSEAIQKANDAPKGSEVWTARRRCVKLCQDLRGPNVVTPIAVTDNEEDAAVAYDNLAIEQPPFTTKDQLHSLRAFKCSLLNDGTKKQTTKDVETMTKQQHHHSHDVGDDEDEKEKDDTDDGEPDLVLQCGLYRLLLEWSLSNKTPLPFQRAIQSNLKTIVEQHQQQHHVAVVDRNVLESIWTTPGFWKDSLHALEVAVNYAPLLETIQGNRDVWLGCMRFLCQSTLVVDMLEKSKSVKAGVGNDRGISLLHDELHDILRLVNILKLVLGGDPSRLVVASNDESEYRVSELLEKLQVFVFVLLASPNMLIEGFNTLGVLYGRIIFLLSYDNANNDESTASRICIDTIETMQRSSLSPLSRLSVVQGMAAAMDAESLTKQSGNSSSLLQAYWRYTLQAGRASTDPLVRWAAIKGLSTLATRRKQQLHTQQLHTETSISYEKTDNKRGKRGKQQRQQQQNARSDDESLLVDETLEFVFDSWENPPLRKVGTAIPGLFRTLVQLVQPTEIPKIFRRVLLQPTNRKGRYVALDCLLPFLSLSSQSPSESIPILPIESLLEGIGDRGPNSVAIANLWIKILKQMWTELCTSHTNASDTKNENETQVQRIFGVWLSLWVPSFCSAILAPSMNRRKQIMAYCLPRAGELMRDIKLLKNRIPLMLGSCLMEIHGKRGASYAAISMASITSDTIVDRILWVELEIVRFASVMRVPLLHLKSRITQCIPKETYRLALRHALPSIRIASFRAMEYLVPAYILEHISNLDNLKTEAGMWRQALPYSIKSDIGKECLSSLIQTLFLFMDRLATEEAAFTESVTNASTCLPLFQAFAIDFLIKDMIVAKTIYPGTTADKEAFGIALLDSLLAYALQDDKYNGNNTIAQNGAIFIRRRGDLENLSMKKLLAALGDSEVFSALMGLLHSIWDTTRIDAFRFLSKLVVACQVEGVALPTCFSVESERLNALARGVYLASSPRQREADTGARMLLFLYASTPNIHAKHSFFMNLIDMSDERISLMRAMLSSLIAGKSALMENGCSLDGSTLPLAYGLIHAARLCVQHEVTAKRLGGIHESDIEDYMLDRTVDVCNKALQLSLLVVADVPDGEIIDGVDSVSAFNMDGPTTDSTPLNVNTGAIGANGTFSLVNGAGREEAKSRLAMQRLVVSMEHASYFASFQLVG